MSLLLVLAAAAFAHGGRVPPEQVPPQWRPAIAGLCRAWARLDLGADDPRSPRLDPLLSPRTRAALPAARAAGCRHLAHPGSRDARLDAYSADLLVCSQRELAGVLRGRQAQSLAPVSFRLRCLDTYDEFFHDPSDLSHNMIQPDFALTVFEGDAERETVEGFFHIHFDDSVSPSGIYSLSVYVPAALVP